MKIEAESIVKEFEKEWRWCLVGNIVKFREYGEEHELRSGTKRFSGGTKVYLCPAQWGDGYENVVVIGKSRHSFDFIEVVIPRRCIENYRLQKVYKPTLLNKMKQSKYTHWSNTDRDLEEIIHWLEQLNPEEAEKVKRKYVEDMHE